MPISAPEAWDLQAVAVQQGGTASVSLLFVLTLLVGMFPSAGLASSPAEGDRLNRIVVTREDIRGMNVRTIVDLLNRIPGVSAGESVVRIRGSSVVRVLLDGRPINDPLSSHQGIKWNLVPFNSIKEIVIYKGEGSVVYGENTTGGVISITTEKTEGSHGKAEAAAGNLDSSELNLDYRRNAGPFGVGVSMSVEKSDGYRVNGDKDSKRMGLKFGYMKSKDYNLDLFLDYGREERGIPGLPEFPTPEARSENRMFGVLLNGKAGQLQSRSYFTRFNKEHVNPEIDLETWLSSWRAGQTLDSSLSMKRLGLFNLGAMAEVAGVKGNRVRSRQEEKYGLYVTKGLSCQSVPLTLSLGLRGNFYSDFPAAINPEIKVGFEQDTYRIMASVSTTNNTPTFIQRYYESSTMKINPDLGMERSVNYSLSVFLGLQDRFEGTMALFFGRTADRITYVRLDDGTGSYENFGEVIRKGADLSFKWKALEFIEIKSSYTYLSAEDTATGNWLPYMPRHRVKLDVRCRLPQRLTIGLYARYASRQFSRSDNSESVPAYLVTDLRAKYHFREDVQLFADVENLFNNSYFYGDGYPAPPRTWLLGLGYVF